MTTINSPTPKRWLLDWFEGKWRNFFDVSSCGAEREFARIEAERAKADKESSDRRTDEKL